MWLIGEVAVWGEESHPQEVYEMRYEVSNSTNGPRMCGDSNADDQLFTCTVVFAQHKTFCEMVMKHQKPTKVK